MKDPEMFVKRLLKEIATLKFQRDQARVLANKWRRRSNFVGNEADYMFPWEER